MAAGRADFAGVMVMPMVMAVIMDFDCLCAKRGGTARGPQLAEQQPGARARYRSYRAYDNTFQPNYGGRRQCFSPYY